MLHSGYVRVAGDAISHVKSKVRYRGLNTAGGWIRDPANVPQKFYARLKSLYVGAQRSSAYGGKFDSGLYIREMARLAIETGTGNCSELSAVAFLYLAKQNVTPIEYFGVIRGSWNHAFVILNRDESIPIANFKDWSYDAVVCDPLYDRYGDAGHLKMWYTHMFPLNNADMWLRLVA